MSAVSIPNGAYAVRNIGNVRNAYGPVFPLYKRNGFSSTFCMLELQFRQVTFTNPGRGRLPRPTGSVVRFAVRLRKKARKGDKAIDTERVDGDHYAFAP